MLHIPFKNSEHTGTKENYCLVNHFDVEGESEGLEVKSSSGNERTA